jgi:hypothetical protein
MYATPSVLKRYAPVGFAAAACFFEAEAFSCPRDALERISSTPQQIQAEKIEIATAFRRRPVRMNFLFLSALVSHSLATHPAALEFSRLPHPPSIVLCAFNGAFSSPS